MTRAGASFGHGIQHDKLLKFEINGTAWVDTPGLSDLKFRTRAAGQITEALKDQEGLYRLIFVVTTEAGRVRVDDLATMTIVLTAIRKKNVPYGVIVNKISERLLGRMLSEAKFYDELICSLNSGPYSTEHIFLAPEDPDARDADNYIIAAPAMAPVLDFIDSVPCIAIRPTDVEDIKTSDFDDQGAKLKQLVQTMVDAHSKQLEQLAIMHQSAMEQHRETLRLMQADQARRDKATNHMLESLRNQAAEESQRRDKIQERLEEVLASTNRSQQLARQEHMKTMLEMEKIRAEAREKELKMKIEAERKRLESESAHQKQMRDMKAVQDQLQGRVQAQERIIRSEEKKQNDGGCFAGSGLVQLASGRVVPIRDLCIGDHVKVYDPVGDGDSGKEQFEQVLEFYDYDPHVHASFVSLDTGADRAPLVLTEHHFVLAAASLLPEDPAEFTRACNLKPGMYLIAGSDGRRLCIRAVHHVVEQGLFSPATTSGTLVINGIAASVYAKPEKYVHVPVSDAKAHKMIHNFTEELRNEWAMELSSPATAQHVAMSKMDDWRAQVEANRLEDGGLQLKHKGSQALKIHAHQELVALSCA
ncbi:hypothetical protein GGF32_007001 [Allomyces javanicus]|nr:hypothetical protein GGF32_007001 [Allomyces javanicus]